MSTPPVSSSLEAQAMLTTHALNVLWATDDMGCCHVCCAPCAALDYLDRRGLLDLTLAWWAEVDGHSWWDARIERRDDRLIVHGQGVDRAWMHRQWSGSKVQEQCGHRWSES